MFKADRLQQLQTILLCVLAFVIPLPFIYQTIAIILLTVTWLLTGCYRETWQQLRQNKGLWAWVLFFILHAISYTYSANKDKSLFDIQSKLSFLIMPVVIGAGVVIDKERLEKIFLAFTTGVTATAIFCLVQAVFRYQETGATYVFFYHSLIESLEANAVYEAWYVLFSLAVLLFYPWQVRLGGHWRWLRPLMTVLQLFFFILLSARMLLVLFLILVIPLYIKKLLVHRHLSRIQTGLLGGTVLVLLLALVFTNNPIRKRYQDIIGNDLQQAWRKDYRQDDQKFSNLTLRLFLWRVGMENIQEHQLWLTGAGNGDVSELQNRKLAAYGIRDMDNPVHRSELYNVNLHNMYLQSLMMLGIPGLLTFLVMLFSPFLALHRLKEKNIFIILSVSALFFMFQESALQTQAGIVFFTFFSQILWQISFLSVKRSKY